jgi:ankyrin repeat protein
VQGASPNAQNLERTTPFHYLVRQQLTTEIEALLERCLTKGADLEAKNKYGESALQQACSRLNESSIAWLVAHKANVNSANECVRSTL